ncbi:MAG: hypothetical protein SPG48_12755 [Treponema sp.]|nr:hypothetical protein [Treponema sp.]
MNILKNNNFFEKKFSLHLGWDFQFAGRLLKPTAERFVQKIKQKAVQGLCLSCRYNG